MTSSSEENPKIVCIIPARYGSSRLPGKPLADLEGKTVIQRTCDQVSKVIKDYIVATDDQRIIDNVESFGGKAMMTRNDHKSGSDRVAEIAKNIEADIIVNVQGDEPFINPKQIEEAVKPLLDDPTVNMATLCRPIHNEEELNNIGVVKVITDINGDAIYFSRSLIPYPRHKEYAKWYEHVGLYVYRKDFLLKFVSWPPSDLELAESLEQLRVLDHGQKIRVIETKHDLGAVCIDTPEDLEKAREYLKKEGL
jgi:3-deoxy-manno-octulosonate cytidylyltransferase (CMP-KDO synthetase)